MRAANGHRRLQVGGVNSRLLIGSCSLPSHEVVRLLAAITGRSRAELLSGMVIDRSTVNMFYRLVEQRSAGMPLQYLEGTVQFGPLELLVDDRVLIPRPETEQLWEKTLDLVPDGACTVVDMGTGSGCLAIGIAHQRPAARVIATDISRDALDLARLNAALMQVEAEFCLGDRFDALHQSLRGDVDVIVTNPPYVSDSEWLELPPEVRDYEPRLALAAGDGLHIFRYLASEAPSWLAPGGALVAEIGDRQGAKIRWAFRGPPWEASVLPDLAGRDRFLIARITA
ncbi:MAG: peptide chain release factor N(5)-glutamine methyltransferase [bacterium]|nr:peptide chain release factor N(5)-glutamine methyltransferase [bacterium]